MGPVAAQSPSLAKTYKNSDDPSSVLFTGKFDATASKQKSKLNLEFPI
jgi:hypothetical protein